MEQINNEKKDFETNDVSSNDVQSNDIQSNNNDFGSDFDDIPKNDFSNDSNELNNEASNDFDDDLNGENIDEDLVNTSSSYKKYDWTKAPKNSAPPRVDLDGQEITVESADIFIPDESVEWTKPLNGKVPYKACTLKVFYDKEKQQENYSGLKVFPSKTDPKKYSHPTIDNRLTRDGEEIPLDRLTQATKLLKAFADFRNKDIKEVSLNELMAFLNSKPKALIQKVSVENPKNKKIVKKNLIVKFL